MSENTKVIIQIMSFTEVNMILYTVAGSTQVEGEKETACVDQVIKFSLHTFPSVV